jgi:hypothetical protein
MPPRPQPPAASHPLAPCPASSALAPNPLSSVQPAKYPAQSTAQMPSQARLPTSATPVARSLTQTVSHNLNQAKVSQVASRPAVATQLNPHKSAGARPATLMQRPRPAALHYHMSTAPAGGAARTAAAVRPPAGGGGTQAGVMQGTWPARASAAGAPADVSSPRNWPAATGPMAAGPGTGQTGNTQFGQAAPTVSVELAEQRARMLLGEMAKKAQAQQPTSQ